MQNAPAVSYPVGRSRFQLGLIGFLSLGGAIAGVMWHYQASIGGWRLATMCLTWTIVLWIAVNAWKHAPDGSLCWDGQVWNWTCRDASATGVLSIHLDLQVFLVLSMRTEVGARIWLWPERSIDTAHWDALRRAVFACNPAH